MVLCLENNFKGSGLLLRGSRRKRLLKDNVKFILVTLSQLYKFLLQSKNKRQNLKSLDSIFLIPFPTKKPMCPAPLRPEMSF